MAAIDNNPIANMTIQEVIITLVRVDTWLIHHVNPKTTSQHIRNQLLVRYNHLTDQQLSLPYASGPRGPYDVIDKELIAENLTAQAQIYATTTANTPFQIQPQTIFADAHSINLACHQGIIVSPIVETVAFQTQQEVEHLQEEFIAAFDDFTLDSEDDTT